MEVNRKNRLLFGLVAVATLLLVKLFYIQIINDKYKRDASNNSMVYNYIYPPRGVIYDRNGEILVGNEVCYDISVRPRDVTPFDTLALAEALGVEADFIRERMAYYRKYRTRIGWQTLTLLKHIPQENYIRFIEEAYRFPGFKAEVRSVRQYPFNAGGNLLGYISEVDADYLKQQLVADVVNIRQPFSVYVGTTRRIQDEFFLCWDYETGSDDLDGFPNRPITGRIQVGTPIPITKYANYSQEVLINYYAGAAVTRVSLGTTTDVRNYLQNCASGHDRAVVFPRYSLVDHTELGFNLTIIPKCHRWQLYYQNLLGGIDCLVIEGKTVQRDKFGRVVISKAYNNANITIFRPISK